MNFIYSRLLNQLDTQLCVTGRRFTGYKNIRRKRVRLLFTYAYNTKPYYFNVAT